MLTPLALITVMIVAPFYYAMEYPLAAAGFAVWGTSFGIAAYRWRRERKLRRRLEKRTEKISLIREAIRAERN